MKAVRLDAFGPPENFRVVDLPIPEPGEGEVLIKVEAAGIVFADTQMRRGDYVNLPALPFTPGREVSGVVERLGPKVTKVKPGMRVTADMHTGGYAAYAIASEKNVIRLPERVSFLQGIVYHINLRIAYLCYYTFGKIGARETILLHAAAGGIGTLVTQVAKRRGRNTVIALSSSDEKLAYCMEVGADHCINYTKTDYVEEVLRITGGEGVDVSINSVGGPTLATDPRAIKPTGRWLIYGYAGGRGVIDPNAVMPRSLTVTIFSVYTIREREHYKQATAFLREWLRTEDLVPASKTFPLEDVVAAHHWIEGRHSHGKIALVPPSEGSPR